jgi:N-acetyl sugar amidotransferase
MIGSKQRCTKCILPEEYPGISFDEKGVCNYCRSWETKWHKFDFAYSETLLENILSKYRGKSEPYDCLIGLSGGKDSSYAAYVLKKHNMNPLSFTFDNGFLSERALYNINSTVKALSLGHVFVGPNADYLSKFYKHFILTAGEFCTVCNTGIRAALYRTARSYGINLIVSGFSPRTEANSPKEFFTSSTGYFHNVCKDTFSRKEIKGYEYVNLIQRVSSQIRRSPFLLYLPNYMPWNEGEFIAVLAAELNWKGSFGEQHTDCRMNDAKEYLKLKKFGMVELVAKFSSLIRDKQLTRDEALSLSQQYMDQLIENEHDIRELIKNELNLTENLLDKAIHTSHLKYISKTDTMFDKAKNLREIFNTGRKVKIQDKNLQL